MAKADTIDGGAKIHLEDVKRLSLEPGDVLVVHASEGITAEHATVIVERLQALISEHKVVVLAPGFDLESVKPASRAARERKVQRESFDARGRWLRYLPSQLRWRLKYLPPWRRK